jgi:hypothetical protein
VLGAAYGLCLIAGLLGIQRLAEAGAVAGLTAAYYALSYLGFAVPYGLALAAHLATYPLLLAISAAAGDHGCAGSRNRRAGHPQRRSRGLNWCISGGPAGAFEGWSGTPGRRSGTASPLLR